MDLRDAIQMFVNDARSIMDRLRVEGEGVTRADLHILEVQLYLLEKEVTKYKSLKGQEPTHPRPSFPPFTASRDDDKK